MSECEYKEISCGIMIQDEGWRESKADDGDDQMYRSKENGKNRM